MATTAAHRAEDFVHGFPVPLDPEAIERELAAMWTARGPGQDPDDEDAGAARVTLGNVVWLGSSRHVPRIRRVFAGLVSRFPCRLFLLEFVSGRDEPGIDAFVNAHCFLSPGMEREVCCEEIHLRFGPQSCGMASGAVLPLLVPDVKTCLWWFTSTPWDYEAASAGLTRLADTVVREAAFLPDPADGLRMMASGEREVIDLAWVRSAPLREHIALLFDDPENGKRLAEIDRVAVRWRGGADSRTGRVAASLLAGWLASRLGWTIPPEESAPFAYGGPNGPVAIDFRGEPGDPPATPGGIEAIEAHFSGGGCFKLLLDPKGRGLQRVIEEADGSCPVGRRALRSASFDEAEALGAALISRRGAALFRDAAAKAWPLLLSLQRS